jgi:hypothetical protein
MSDRQNREQVCEAGLVCHGSREFSFGTLATDVEVDCEGRVGGYEGEQDTAKHTSIASAFAPPTP